MWPGMGYFTSVASVISLVKWELCIRRCLRSFPTLTSYISVIQTFELDHISIQKICTNVFTQLLCVCMNGKFTIWKNGLCAVSNSGSLLTGRKHRHFYNTMTLPVNENIIRAQVIPQVVIGLLSASFSKLVVDLFLWLLVILLQWKDSGLGGVVSKQNNASPTDVHVLFPITC